MKWCLKFVVLLLNSGLYLQTSLLLAQEVNAPSQSASDIQKTAPATISGQAAEAPYSKQNLCQIGEKLSKTVKPHNQARTTSSEAAFNSPDGRKINRGIPLDKVLGSVTKEGNDNNSKALPKELSSNTCK